MNAATATDASMTPEWLTHVLRKNGHIGAAHVVGVDSVGFGAEIGFLDRLFRVVLTYDRVEPGAPASLVVKVSAAEERFRAIGEFYDAYNREFKFYESIAPDAPIRLPRCYGREVIAEMGAHLLLLEDLSRLTPGNQVVGLSVEQAAAAVATIGTMHAHWWDSAALESLAWMPNRTMDVSRYRAAWPEFRRSFHGQLSERALRLGDTLDDQLESLLEAFDQSPRTLVHSDFRADNLLFGDLSAESPVVVVDWQLAIRSRGILDVARLICGSIVPAERAKSELALLQRWHESLERGGVRGYSFERAAEDYRNAALICLYYPVTIHLAEEAAGKRGAALAHCQIERFFAAAEHLHAGA
jgi:aminoglycoside phosphotransferase (APT) family kinase protein